MKTLIAYINEKLKISSNDLGHSYKYFPKTKEELKDLLLDEDSAKPLKIVIKPLYRISNPELNPYKDIKSILNIGCHFLYGKLCSIFKSN